jgi:CelD/BcsL family acetyltransferase involved in cellulose biosynthesis
MPPATPLTTTPEAAPRRSGGTARWMAGPASDISTPPASPARSRQGNSQKTPPGIAQASSETSAPAMPSAKAGRVPMRRPSACAPMAPPT